MKISVIGAGNVGGLTAMRLAQDGLGDIFLVDIAKGIAQGKAFDMDDSRLLLKSDFNITGTDDINGISGSDIVIVTAGLARKPGMTREDLLNKNAQILKDVCLNIKSLSPQAIVIIVTNPLDLMTRLALQVTGFAPSKVFGMGITLDASRFANLISNELNIPVTEIEPCVIGSHGEGMMPLTRFTKVKGSSLDKIVGSDKARELAARTFDRGKEIVSLLGSGSAYFAPSAAIAELAGIIARGHSRVVGVSAYLNGEYGIKDVCIGSPCKLGKSGIEKVIELELNTEELSSLQACAAKLKEQYKEIK
ncbi:MAG: malate dehydrogenase [Candidatus Omnitrophota bacterium]